MEFIDQIVIPPSANHVLLLEYIYVISMLLFLPYLGMLMGASVISVYFNGKGIKTGNSLHLRFAKDVINKLAMTKYAAIGLGLIPLLSLTFIYAQLLYGAKTVVIAIFLLSLIIFEFAFIFIYRFSSKLKNISRLNEENAGSSDGNKIKNRNSLGIIGVALLYIAAFLFTGGMALASNPVDWAAVKKIYMLFISGAVYFNFIYLLSLSGAITGAAILFYFFKWQGGVSGMSEEYTGFVKHFAAVLGFVSSICLPVFMFISFLFLPSSALSSDVFVLLVLALITALVLSNMLYMMIKNSEVRMASIVFFFVMIFFAFNILKEQSVLGNALTEQTYAVILKADKHEKEVKSKLVTTSGINGEEIYNTKCIACHKFDIKVVGPPYKETVPKYNGDVQQLAEYIYNPVKKDPAYPPMPNQGLKKKEAVAVAQYLLDQLAGKK
jgi:cytochrome c